MRRMSPAVIVIGHPDGVGTLRGIRCGVVIGVILYFYICDDAFIYSSLICIYCICVVYGMCIYILLCGN